ncbi:MAG: trigger factor [Treponema sp.]|nr:trigger factor [Treponema sp.]
MTVSKEISPLEHSALRLTITVGKDDVLSLYDETLSDYGKTFQIPGFRKGKVPKEVLERKLGDALKEDVLGRIIDRSASSVLDDESFPPAKRPLPYCTPKTEGKPVLNLGDDLVYSLLYDVLPTVTLGQWKGFEVEIPDVRIGDEDVAHELETLRDRNSVVQDREDETPASLHDVVTVNYSELSENGELIPGTERQDFVFTIGTRRNVFKFDDDIIGMKKGESKEFEKTYPADFEDADLAGKTKKLCVSITALKEKILPELDDEFAQDVDEKYKTLDDIKKGIRYRLEKELEARLKNVKTNRLLEKIMETTPVDLPESMIRFQLESQWRNISRNMNVSPDKPYEEFMEVLRPNAIRALHSRLIVEALFNEFGLGVSDEELETFLQHLADEEKTSLEEIRGYYAKDEMKEALKDNIKERKLFDILLAENRVNIGAPQSYQEFSGDANR